MSVVAKMKCTENSPSGGGRKVVLYPVVGGSTENEQFYKYTPSGECRLEILNESAASEFEVGKEYLITFKQVS